MAQGDSLAVEPRFETGRAMRVVGLAETYTFSTMGGIAGQWARFSQSVDAIGAADGLVETVAYGIVTGMSEAVGRFNYMTALEIGQAAAMPAGFSELRVPASRFAVFTHRGHISTLSHTVEAVFGDWMPASGYHHAGTVDLIERYTDAFDPVTGMGEVDILVPIKG